MKKTRISRSLVIGGAIAALAFLRGPAVVTAPALAAAAPASAELPRNLEMGTGTIGGAFHVWGAALARLLTKELGIPVVDVPTAGSAENIRLLDRGRLRLAGTSANSSYPAFRKLPPFAEKEYKAAGPIMNLYPHHSIFVALADRGIKRIADLRGKRVGLGVSEVHWGNLFTKPILRAHGLDPEKDLRAVYGSLGDLHTQVGDGILDATTSVVPGGRTPIPALTALMTTKKVEFVRMDPQALDRLEKEVPYMPRLTIPKGVLPGWDVDFPTADNGGAQVFVRYDLPQELVYRITKIIHQNLPKLAETVGFFKYPRDHSDFLVKDLAGAPFHPGAVRYWKEVGLWPR